MVQDLTLGIPDGTRFPTNLARIQMQLAQNRHYTH